MYYNIFSLSHTEHAKDVIGKRVLVSHLMMAVANGFDTLMVKHIARGVVDRLALLRLLSVIDHTENVIEDSKHVCEFQLYVVCFILYWFSKH